MLALCLSAFQEGSTIKLDVEALAHRRCVTLHLQVEVSGGETVSQVILAINTDPNHDIFYPQPISNFTGPVTTDKHSSMAEENEIGIVTIDFSVVTSFKVLCCDKDANNHFSTATRSVLYLLYYVAQSSANQLIHRQSNYHRLLLVE